MDHSRKFPAFAPVSWCMVMIVPNFVANVFPWFLLKWFNLIYTLEDLTEDLPPGKTTESPSPERNAMGTFWATRGRWQDLFESPRGFVVMIDGFWFAFPEKLLGNSPGTYHIIPYSLGKLSCFTDLNLKAIKGDDFPYKNHDFQGSGEQWGRDEFYPDIVVPVNCRAIICHPMLLSLWSVYYTSYINP